tara:strand:+ start:869 stop:1696 length:828 start_codon:yes stop_codon:yes gene_type:complete
MAEQIQLRSGTAAAWTAANPTLAQGELGLETDTLKMKLGDGVTAWTAPLAYWGYASLDGINDVTITAIASGEILKWNGSAWINQTLAEAGIAATGHNHSGVYEPKSDVLTDLDTLGAAASDGQVIVATGAGVFAYESGATLRTSLGLAIGTDVQAYDVDTLKADTHDTLSAGFDSDVEAYGTVSSGTTTPEVDSATEENFKTLTNGGAFTLAAPSTSSSCVIVIQVTNNASAGTITFSGFTLQDGDDLTTTNGDDFFITIVKVGTFITATVKALQ